MSGPVKIESGFSKPVTVEAFGERHTIILKIHKYVNNGRIAVVAEDAETGEPFGTVSTNLPNEHIELNEFCVKNYSENAWVPQLLNLLPDFLEDTGAVAFSGHAAIPVWRILTPKV